MYTVWGFNMGEYYIHLCLLKHNEMYTTYDNILYSLQYDCIFIICISRNTHIETGIQRFILEYLFP